MPRIPFYPQEQHARLHPLESSANPQGVAGQAARVLDEFGTRLQVARTHREISAAQNDAYARLHKLKQGITESGDWQTSGDAWQKGVDKIRADLQKAHPHVADRVLPTFEHASIAGRYDVQRWAWQHEQDHSRAQFYEHTKANVARAVSAQTPEERQLYRDQIVQDSAAAAGNFVTEVQADRVRDGALSDIDKQRAEVAIEHDPAGALRMLDDKGELPSLDTDSRVALHHRAERELKSRQAAARAELSSRLSDDIASIERTGQGVAGIDERMAAAGYSAADIAEHKKRQTMALTIYHTHTDFQTMTPEQMQASVDALKPEPGAEDFEDKYKLYQGAERLMTRVLSERHADPAGFAWRVHPPQGDTLEQKIDAGLATQAAQGVAEKNRRVLPKKVADNLIQQWRDGAPDEKVSLIQQVVDGSGKYSQRVLTQLINDGLPVGAGVMLHVSSDVRDDMAQAAGMSDAELKKASGNPSSLSDEVTEDLKPFLHTLPPDIHLRGQYLHLAHKMAMFYAARGDDNPAQEAVDNLYGNYFSYVGTLRIPKGRGYDPAKVANYGDWVLRNLNGRDLNDRGQPPMFFAERAYHEGHWITDSDGKSATLYIDHAPVTYAPGTAQAGKPVKLYFDHAAGFDYAVHAGPGKGHLENPESHGFIGGTPSPLAYKGAPLVPESRVQSDINESASGMGTGQVNAGGAPAPTNAPNIGTLPPKFWDFVKKYVTEDQANAGIALLRLLNAPVPKKAKSKPKEKQK